MSDKTKHRAQVRGSSQYVKPARVENFHTIESSLDLLEHGLCRCLQSRQKGAAERRREGLLCEVVRRRG